MQMQAKHHFEQAGVPFGSESKIARINTHGNHQKRGGRK